MDKKPIKIIQISDIHLFAEQNDALLGVRPYDSFQAVLDLLHQEPNITAIILTGDLSQDGSETAYKELANLLDEFNVPVYFVPGNHDDMQSMSRVYPRGRLLEDRQIILDGWQVILLNSQQEGKVEGYLGPQELQFMQACLKDYPHHQAIIVFHHHPIPMHSAWLDPIGIVNRDEFWQTVSKYPSVNSILFGHVHQESFTQHNGVSCFSAPSTCIQFKPKQQYFVLDENPPGYRVIQLHPNGRIESEVKRVASYVGDYDPDAKGY